MIKQHWHLSAVGSFKPAIKLRLLSETAMKLFFMIVNKSVAFIRCGVEYNFFTCFKKSHLIGLGVLNNGYVALSICNALNCFN